MIQCFPDALVPSFDLLCERSWLLVGQQEVGGRWIQQQAKSVLIISKFNTNRTSLPVQQRIKYKVRVYVLVCWSSVQVLTSRSTNFTALFCICQSKSVSSVMQRSAAHGDLV